MLLITTYNNGFSFKLYPITLKEMEQDAQTKASPQARAVQGGDISLRDSNNFKKGELTNEICLRCGYKVFKEKGELKKKYPFYCACCDENMFKFEVKNGGVEE